MTPQQMRTALTAIDWTVRHAALEMGQDMKRMQRFVNGVYPIPPRVGDWLASLAEEHVKRPPPSRGASLRFGVSGDYRYTHPEDLRWMLDCIGWDIAHIARALKCSSTVIYRWLDGLTPIPAEEAIWLRELALAHNRLRARYGHPKTNDGHLEASAERRPMVI